MLIHYRMLLPILIYASPILIHALPILIHLLGFRLPILLPAHFNTLSRFSATFHITCIAYLNTLTRLPILIHAYLNTLSRLHILIHCQNKNIPYLNTWEEDTSRLLAFIAYLNT